MNQSVRRQSWWERLALWLFPQYYPPPVLEKPGFAPGELSTDCFIVFGWSDRLRVLVSGKAVARIRTLTDAPIRKVETRSTFSVLPPWKWERWGPG